MSEPVYDHYATRIVQDLEDDLYDSKRRVQRLRRQNDELAAENERLRDAIKRVAGDLGESAEYAPNVPRQEAYLEAERAVLDILSGDEK